MKGIARLLFLSTLMFAGGCISRRIGTYDGQLSPTAPEILIIKGPTDTADPIRFIVGRTSRHDVLRVWGNPTRIKNRTWTYSQTDSLGAQAKLSHYGLSLGIGDLGTQTRHYELTFNEGGILRSIQISETAPDAYHWKVWPF